MDMKSMHWMLASLLLLICTGTASAQVDKATAALTASAVVDWWVSNAEAHVMPVLEAMPEARYSFAPTNGEFNGVRTFAEQGKHLAANNYRMAAKMLGEKPTADQENERGPDSVKTKAEITVYVGGSFAALHKAVADMDAANEVTPLSGTSGTWQRTRLGLAIDAVAHSFDHYGQMVEYLRMNGIVPPDSR